MASNNSEIRKRCMKRSTCCTFLFKSWYLKQSISLRPGSNTCSIQVVLLWIGARKWRSPLRRYLKFSFIHMKGLPHIFNLNEHKRAYLFHRRNITLLNPWSHPPLWVYRPWLNLFQLSLVLVLDRVLNFALRNSQFPFDCHHAISAHHTQTCSDPSALRLLFTNSLKPSSRRRCSPICPNFLYWPLDSFACDYQYWQVPSKMH